MEQMDALLPRFPQAATPPAASASDHRLAFIDFLRGVAVLLVFFRHSSEAFVVLGHGDRLLTQVGNMLNFGGLGVAIFFAISGFVIPWSLHGPRLAGAVRYVISRVFRLYPAFLVSVIPSAATHFWVFGWSFSWHKVLVNFTMVPRLFGVEMANGAYWTLEIEVAFYFLCLFLFLGGLLNQAFTMAAILVACFVIYDSSQQPYFNGLLNPSFTAYTYFFALDISVMCWGAVAREWWSGRRLNFATACIFWGFAAYWILYFPLRVAAAALRHDIGAIDTRLVAAYSGAVLIFLLAIIHGRLRNRVMSWIGRISYSFYLLHGVAIHLIGFYFGEFDALRGYHNGLYTAAALLLSLVFAQISYTLVERPFIHLGRQLTGVVLPRLAGAATWRLRWTDAVFARPVK